MTQIYDNMEYQGEHGPPLVYWNSWRRSHNSCTPTWSLNRIPGMMLHNNARMQFMQTPQLYPFTQPVCMAPPQHNINKFYNNPFNIYEESQPQLVPQQPQFIPQPQFQSVKFVEIKREVVTPPSLSPAAIKVEPQDEFENKFNLTEPLYENPEIGYNTILPQVMNEVNKRIGTLDVDLPITNKSPPLEQICETTEKDFLTKQNYDGNSILYQNEENKSYDSLNMNTSLISSPSAYSTAYGKDTSATVVGLATDKQEEVIKAAKSLFSKRTRTLLHWLNPNSSKSQLKGNVSAAWDTLPDREKSFYISQVLGKFALHNSSLMVNPQLGTTQCTIPGQCSNTASGAIKSKISEDQSAVNSLFESCDDADKWTSYSRRKYKKLPSKTVEIRKKRPRKSNLDKDENKCLYTYDPDLEHELRLLNKMRENCQGLDEFKDDSELVKEIEKFRLMNEQIEEDFWDNAPDPDDLFSDLNI